MGFSKRLFNLDWQIFLTPFRWHMQRLTLSLLMHLPFGPVDGIFLFLFICAVASLHFPEQNVALSKIPSEQ